MADFTSPVLLPLPPSSGGANGSSPHVTERRPRRSLAIIGTGIAGLGCAHFLHAENDLTLYEQNDYAGGHANTVDVPGDTASAPVDTGFMVYNEVTYPLLTRLFRELGVETKPAPMSFSVQHRGSGLDYCGSGFGGLFAQRRNLLSPRFWKMLGQIDRFNREAIPALDDPAVATQTVGQYVAARGYGDDFLRLFLVPMSSAVWSTPPRQMLDFPAVSLLRFFHNHGFLGLHAQHAWRTPAQGSRAYVQKLMAPWRSRVRLQSGVAQVFRRAGRAYVRTTAGEVADYDAVIFATHADQALRLLADPTPLEARLLGEFHYQPNTATLHTDATVMPRTRRCWSSWNYQVGDADDVPVVHYWMNSLQGVSRTRDYFLSLNAAARIDPARVVRTIAYEHPLFSLGALAAQKELPQLNRLGPAQNTYYCGSYFRYGFHEDAFASALECARAVAGRAIWT